jgi:hypothetical protein
MVRVVRVVPRVGDVSGVRVGSGGIWSALTECSAKQAAVALRLQASGALGLVVVASLPR